MYIYMLIKLRLRLLMVVGRILCWTRISGSMLGKLILRLNVRYGCWVGWKNYLEDQLLGFALVLSFWSCYQEWIAREGILSPQLIFSIPQQVLFSCPSSIVGPHQKWRQFLHCPHICAGWGNSWWPPQCFQQDWVSRSEDSKWESSDGFGVVWDLMLQFGLPEFGKFGVWWYLRSAQFRNHCSCGGELLYWHYQFRFYPKAPSSVLTNGSPSTSIPASCRSMKLPMDVGNGQPVLVILVQIRIYRDQRTLVPEFSMGVELSTELLFHWFRGENTGDV